MTPHATLQVLCESDGQTVGVLRVHTGDGSWLQRSPYSWCSTLVVRGDEAEVLGVLKAPNGKERKAIRELLESQGVKQVQYEIKGRRIWHEGR